MYSYENILFAEFGKLCKPKVLMNENQILFLILSNKGFTYMKWKLNKKKKGENG